MSRAARARFHPYAKFSISSCVLLWYCIHIFKTLAERTIRKRRNIPLNVLDDHVLYHTNTSHGVLVCVYACQCVSECCGNDISSFVFILMLCVGKFHSMSSLWSSFTNQFVDAYIQALSIFSPHKRFFNQMTTFVFGLKAKLRIILLEIGFIFHNLLTIVLIYWKHKGNIDVILRQLFFEETYNIGGHRRITT